MSVGRQIEETAPGENCGSDLPTPTKEGLVRQWEEPMKGFHSLKGQRLKPRMSLATNVRAKGPTHKPNEFIIDGFRAPDTIRGSGKSTAAPTSRYTVFCPAP